MKKALVESIPASLPPEEKKLILKDLIELYMSPTELRKYANDDVFKHEFWHTISYAVSTTYAKDFNMNNWLSSPMDDLTTTTNDDLEKATIEGKINLKNKKGSVELFVKKGKPYFLWLATRMGQPTIKGNNPPGLEVIPIFELSE